MIVFDLLCTCGFQFEGWFRDSDSFQEQQEAGLLTCPQCGNRDVHKILSPVASVRTGPAAPDPAGGDASLPKAAAMLQALQTYVTNHFEDVGAGLAKEALKIRYGLKEPRNIRGVATPNEEKTLKEEGIELLKIPMPAKDQESQ